MKAIVLSAGQGRRLLPLTARSPKCLLPVDAERPILELQLETLARCGVEHATVVTGFRADRVERFLAGRRFEGLAVETLFNPFFACSDNLATCWLARSAMDGDFLLINGDTLFEDRVLRRLLEQRGPVTVTVDHKREYDDDDMKVSLDESGRLLAIGKTLKPEIVHGESIGMLSFRGPGGADFRQALEAAIRRPDALRSWYLSIINRMAQRSHVDTASIRGFWWREIDSPEDLAEARADFIGRREASGRAAVVGASAGAKTL